MILSFIRAKTSSLTKSVPSASTAAVSSASAVTVAASSTSAVTKVAPSGSGIQQSVSVKASSHAPKSAAGAGSPKPVAKSGFFLQYLLSFHRFP